MKKTLLFTRIALVVFTILTLNADARERGNPASWISCEDCRSQEGQERQRRASQDGSDATGFAYAHAPAPFQNGGTRSDCLMREQRMGAAEHAGDTVKLRELFAAHRQRPTSASNPALITHHVLSEVTHHHSEKESP